jgi:glycosyltransferase involved in cell wall biosynthesis
MKIGYLHLGPPQHGIHRYGRILARAAQQQCDQIVLEVEVLLTDNSAQNQDLLINAAQKLSEADLIHIQFSYFNDLLWGKDWEQLEHLRIFCSHCACPIVATLHDVYYAPTGFQGILANIQTQFNSNPKPWNVASTDFVSTLRKIVRAARGCWKSFFGSSTASLSELIKNVDLLLVCSQEEAKRLVDHVDPQKLKIIPHFVESRSPSIIASQARLSLNLTSKKVVTILGYVFPAKGHQLLVEAIPYLPSEIEVVFAGNAEADLEFKSSLIALARSLNVDRQIRFTGYLSESEMEAYLLATDLAICAFKGFSASGSISTWISVACPILAFDLPQISEYNAISCEAIQVFSPYTPIALATAIQAFFTRDRNELSTKVAKLGHELSLDRTIKQHHAVYDAVAQISPSNSIG